MYELKPIFENFNITIPKCMYTIKPLNQNQSSSINSQQYDNSMMNGNVNNVEVVSDVGNFGEQIRLCLKGSPQMTNLRERQDKLLKQLQDLQNQLIGIRLQMNLSSSTGVTEKLSTSSLECKVQAINENAVKNSVENKFNIHETFDDIVINASPDCIPYGLLALKNAWSGIFNINVTVHSHSTVTMLNQEAKEFESKVIKKSECADCPNINVVLIWKNSEHTEMVTSSATYVPIYGEVNFLRYLARIGPSDYRYEDDIPTCNEMDAVLDISYQLPCCCGGGKSRSQLLKSLNDRLRKRKYFGGEKCSIADVGAYSALKRSLWLTKNDLTDNLRDWFERVKLITAV